MKNENLRWLKDYNGTNYPVYNYYEDITDVHGLIEHIIDKDNDREVEELKTVCDDIDALYIDFRIFLKSDGYGYLSNYKKREDFLKTVGITYDTIDCHGGGLLIPVLVMPLSDNTNRILIYTHCVNNRAFICDGNHENDINSIMNGDNIYNHQNKKYIC